MSIAGDEVRIIGRTCARRSSPSPGETVTSSWSAAGALHGVDRQHPGAGRRHRRLGVAPTDEIRDLGVLSGFRLRRAGRPASMVVLIFKGIGMMFTRRRPGHRLAGSGGAGGHHPAVDRGRPGRLLPDASGAHQHQPGHPQHAPAAAAGRRPRALQHHRAHPGQSISLRVFERISMVGLALFVLLFLVATSNDIGRISGLGGQGKAWPAGCR